MIVYVLIYMITGLWCLSEIARVVQHRRLGRHLPIVRSAQIPLAFPVTGFRCNLDWLCTHYAIQAGLVLEMILYQHPEYQDYSCPPSHHARLPVTLGEETPWHFVKKRVVFCFLMLVLLCSLGVCNSMLWNPQDNSIVTTGTQVKMSIISHLGEGLKWA